MKRLNKEETAAAFADVFSEGNEATYCPEDDKLRLYVGRVPRDEYLALRSQGWTSTPKQDCDFAAVWTPDREDTAILYAGDIGDEDQDPTDRAADRAERFAGYREKRREEAHGHADKYDAGPVAHGYQNQQKAERAAARHDRHADRACLSWSKAEYWQRRTAGVIANALYRSSPSVRMGRIKKLEAENRKREKSGREHVEKYQNRFDILQGITGERKKVLMPAGWQYTAMYHELKPADGEKYTIEELKLICALNIADDRNTYELLKNGKKSPEGLAREELAKYPNGRPADYVPAGRWHKHTENRLAYERQMLEAAGGRAGAVEIQTGGIFAGGVIAKVNKSHQTGRVVSVAVIVPAVERWTYKTTNTKGTKYALMQMEVERAAPDAYQEPTPESLEKLEEYKKAVKESKKSAPKLINPTREEAQRLQDRLNADSTAKGGKPGEVVEYTQENYSHISKGSDWIGVRVFKLEDAAFKVRACWSYRGADSIVCITDKPQKALPEFAPIRPPVVLTDEEWNQVKHICRPRNFEESHLLSKEDKEHAQKAVEAGLMFVMSASQYGLTEKGKERAAAEYEAEKAEPEPEPVPVPVHALSGKREQQESLFDLEGLAQ